MLTWGLYLGSCKGLGTKILCHGRMIRQRHMNIRKAFKAQYGEHLVSIFWEEFEN